MANVETRRDVNTFLGSGCNIRTHLLNERRLDYKSILSRSGRAVAHDEEQRAFERLGKREGLAASSMIKCELQVCNCSQQTGEVNGC